MTLAFDANCLPVAPWHLPYGEYTAAWSALLNWTPRVLIWPILPTTPEWQLAAAGFPGLHATEPRLERQRFEEESEAHQIAFLCNTWQHAALPSFERQVKQVPARDSEQIVERALVVALYGPVSLALTLVDEQEHPVFNRQALRETLVQHLRLRMGWLEQQLGDLATTTVVCLEEPFWETLRSPFIGGDEALGLSLIEECVQSLQATRGFAPGAPVDWQAVLHSSLQWIVCPATEQAALLGCGRQLNDYFERGGVVVWPLVPGTPTERAQTSVDELVSHWEHTVAQTRTTDLLLSRLLSGSLLSIGPGLAGASPQDADAALEMLAHVARVVRAHYKLT